MYGGEFESLSVLDEEYMVYGVNAAAAFPIVSGLPVYARANLGLNYSSTLSFDGKDAYSYFTSLRPSVDVGYLLTVYKSAKIFFYPGIVSRINLYGRDVYVPEIGDVRARNRMKDVYDNDRMRRFQLGWQVGADAEIERIMFGLFLSGDFTHLYVGDDDDKFGTLLSMKFGYKF